MTHQTLIVLDFGSQFTQLIARRLRELSVYSEILPFNTPAAEIAARKPVGIILSGGPRSVSEATAPRCDTAVFDAGVPVLGICLGLQLFFATSEEAPGAEGLGLLQGNVAKFGPGLPVPHVGWARVEATAAGQAHSGLGVLFRGEPPFFYHVHSYHPHAVLPGDVLATADYGEVFPTIVAHDNVMGAQFHPEKSQRAGLALLDAFARWQP